VLEIAAFFALVRFALFPSYEARYYALVFVSTVAVTVFWRIHLARSLAFRGEFANPFRFGVFRKPAAFIVMRPEA
jgi:hypothetical protein